MASWKTFFDNRKNEYTSNPFWDDINNDHAFTDSTTDNLENLVKHLNKRKLTNYLNRIAKKGIPWEKTYSDDKSFKEVKIAIEALNELGLKKAFLATMADLEWVPTMVNARHFFYSEFVFNELGNHGNKPIRVLEIGGGSGTLSILLRRKLEISNYIDVDFPEMCIVNYYEQRRFLEKNHINFVSQFRGSDESTAINKENDKKLVTYLEPKYFFENYAQLGSFDLILNTHSFQEMDLAIRNRYIDTCCNLLASDGVFFNVNWEHKKMSNRDGTLFDNNPLEYPYPPNVKITKLREDEISKLMRVNRNFKRRTISYTTVIRKDRDWFSKILRFKFQVSR